MNEHYELDQENIKVLNGILAESGYPGLFDWYKEQQLDRQEYVLELMNMMISELINLKTDCVKHQPCKIIPLARKPTLTVVK